MISRILHLLFGLTTYAVFLATFLYLIGFVTGLLVPITVERGGSAGDWLMALAIDVGLIVLFGVQHSIMARPRFKREFTRLIPPAMERSAFVLITCGLFALMFLQWRPIDVTIWSTDGTLATVLHGICFVGWAIALLSTFLIDHFGLFGVRQTLTYAMGRSFQPRRFQERSLYRVMRHPLMFGMLLAFWAAPTMSGGRFVFAIAFTAYVLLALMLEERDLIAEHGAAYREYQRRVPKLLPWRHRRSARRFSA